MAPKAERQQLVPQRAFLTLPLEIRLLIFKFLRHETSRPPITTARDLSSEGWHHSYATIGVSHRGDYKSNSAASFNSLRAVNRQLYRETLEFVRYPGLSIQFLGYLKEESMLSDALASIMKYDFIRENVVDVSFKFYCCDTCYECCRWKLLTKKPAPALPYPWLLWRSSGTHPKPINSQAYRKLVEGLEKCPRLEDVYTCLEHGDLLGWWPEPTRDFAPFEPLLRRGIEVSIEVYRISYRRVTFKVFDGMMDVLNRGLGNIVMSVDPSWSSKEIGVLSVREP